MTMNAATSEANALSDSGLSISRERERCEDGLTISGLERAAFKGALNHGSRRLQTYTGSPIQNRACAIKSWMKWAEFRRGLNLDIGARNPAGVAAARILLRRVLLNHELGAREFRKPAAFCHQFIEGSAFDHPACVEQQDPRGVADGRKPVGDHESGAPLHHFIESGVDAGFGHGVERGGRLVED